MVEEMRRDCLPLWLPEALATIASLICALGGSEEDPAEILEGWGIKTGVAEAREEQTDRILLQWMERNGGRSIADNGSDQENEEEKNAGK